MERKKTRSKQKNLKKDTRSDEVKAGLGKVQQKKNRDVCYLCKQGGHWAKDCPAKEESGEKLEGWGGDDWAGEGEKRKMDAEDGPRKKAKTDEDSSKDVDNKISEDLAAQKAGDEKSEGDVKKDSAKKKKNKKPKKNDKKEARADLITVFVGNLNSKVTADIIAKHFNVKPSVVCRNVKRPKIAFLNFKNQEDADKALELNQSELESGKINVELSKPKKPLTPEELEARKKDVMQRRTEQFQKQRDEKKAKKDRSIYFVGQLHADTTQEILQNHFLTRIDEKNILNVRLLTDPSTGEFKRTAFVDLREGVDASELHQSSLMGRRLVVEPSGKEASAREAQKTKIATEIETYLNEFYATKTGKVLQEHFDAKLLEFVKTCATFVIRSFLKELKKLKESELPTDRSSAWLMGVLRRHQSQSDSKPEYHVDHRTEAEW